MLYSFTLYRWFSKHIFYDTDKDKEFYNQRCFTLRSVGLASIWFYVVKEKRFITIRYPNEFYLTLMSVD